MFGKQKLKAEIVRLTYRVEELEERLCPCEQHEWKRIGYDFKIGCGAGDIETIYTYKCKRCGKQIKTWRMFLERRDSDG